MCLSVSLFVLLSYRSVSARLEPTPLVDNGIYKLLNQHDGRYLTEGSNGVPTKREFAGSMNQKFRFLKSLENGQDVWTLNPLSSSQPLSSTSWQIYYVGHGKYQLKNTKNGLCLQATGTSEASCGKSNPLQRWFAESITEGKSS